MSRQEWKCPICGVTTTEYPAISRVDNETEICSMCGTIEALRDYYKDKVDRAQENLDNLNKISREKIYNGGEE